MGRVGGGCLNEVREEVSSHCTQRLIRMGQNLKGQEHAKWIVRLLDDFSTGFEKINYKSFDSDPPLSAHLNTFHNLVLCSQYLGYENHRYTLPRPADTGWSELENVNTTISKTTLCHC